MSENVSIMKTKHGTEIMKAGVEQLSQKRDHTQKIDKKK